MISFSDLIHRSSRMQATLDREEDANLLRERLQQSTYAQSRAQFSFDRMRRELGHERAVQFERVYQGIEALERQSREALNQVNDIRAHFRKPALKAWPKEPLGDCDACGDKVPKSQVLNRFAYGIEGSFCRRCRNAGDEEESDWTPVDEALGLPVFGHGDFFYCRPKTSDDALDLASDVPCCDVIDLATERPISRIEARHRLEDSKYGEHEKFGVAFPEMLNLFLSDFCAGLYPSL